MNKAHQGGKAAKDYRPLHTRDTGQTKDGQDPKPRKLSVQHADGKEVRSFEVPKKGEAIGGILIGKLTEEKKKEAQVLDFTRAWTPS